MGLLNAFQALSADNVIYFGDEHAANYVERLHAAHCHTSHEKDVVVRSAWSKDGHSELVHQFERVPPLRPDFSFLQLRKMPTDDDLRLPRNEALMATVERLTQASITRSPTFTQKMFYSAINESFVRTADLRARS